MTGVPCLPAGLTMRVLAPDELADLVRLEELVWGWKADEERLLWLQEFLEPAHTIGVFDGSELVASHGMTALRLTVPGGAVVAMAGFTFLVVHPAYRGRGLMSVLTLNGYELARREGRMPVGGGMPHHSRTHLRYGYGAATRYAHVELDLDGQRELRDVVDDGRLELVGTKAALDLLHEVSSQLTGLRNGWVARRPWTDRYKYARAGLPSGTYGPVTFAIHRRERHGRPDGFLSYRQFADSDPYGRPRGTLRVEELFGTSAEVEAQLWQHCIGNPLVSAITATRRPVNDPVSARLRDPRAWRQTVREDMGICFLDIPAALAARRYSREDAVVLEVIDLDGDRRRFVLEGGLAGAHCERSTRSADLTVSLSALGSAYLGDVSLVELAASGQAAEHTPGSLRRASAMFSWTPAPWVQDTF
jgi:predicted acetyltransferase